MLFPAFITLAAQVPLPTRGCTLVLYYLVLYYLAALDTLGVDVTICKP
jgi:hypothetical protein